MKVSAVALLVLLLMVYGQMTAAPGSQSNTGCAISIEPKMWGVESTVTVSADDPTPQKPTARTYYKAKNVEIRIGISVLQADQAVVELAEKPGELANVQLTGTVRLRTNLTLEQIVGR